MTVLSEVRLTVTRTINLGNYESVKLEATAVVGRDSDDDTPKKMRDQVLDEVAEVLAAAKKDYVPQRRSRYDEGG